MTAKTLTSPETGASNDAGTESPPVLPSTSAEKSSTLDMSDTAVPQKHNFLLTLPSESSQENDLETITRMMMAFALSLKKAKLIRWSKVSIDGDHFYAMLFPVEKWEIVGKDLLPRREP